MGEGGKRGAMQGGAKARNDRRDGRLNMVILYDRRRGI